MGVRLRTKNSTFEIGASDFLISFFDTIDYHLNKGIFGKRYKTILAEFYNEELSFRNLEKAERELREIQKRLKKFSPNKVIWDKMDLTKQPPWGGDISSEITDLSNYFVTSDGEDLFEVMFRAIRKAKEEKSAITIE